MRRHLAVLALAVGLSAGPAAADVTARYAPVRESGNPVIIEVDGQGRIRAETNPGQYMIIRDGEAYALLPDLDQAPARVSDMVTLLQERRREAGLPRFRVDIPAATQYRLSERGEQEVGTWRGTVLAIERVGRTDPGLDLVWVVSADPALAEAGRAAVSVFRAQSRLASAILGEELPQFHALVDEIAARGAPLLVGGLYRLESISTDPIPQDRFELPGPVVTLDQMRERMSQQQQ